MKRQFDIEPLGKTPVPVAEYCAELEAEIERLRGASQWQPIETAPRDGTPIVALFPNGEWQRIWWGEYSSISGKKYEGWRIGGSLINIVDPTHWMPLPEPPVSGAPSCNSPSGMTGQGMPNGTLDRIVSALEPHFRFDPEPDNLDDIIRDAALDVQRVIEPV